MKLVPDTPPSSADAKEALRLLELDTQASREHVRLLRMVLGAESIVVRPDEVEEMRNSVTNVGRADLEILVSWRVPKGQFLIVHPKAKEKP